MARRTRRTKRRTSSYSRLYAFKRKKEAMQDATMLRRKGHHVRIRKESIKKGTFKGKVYALYTT